MTWDVAGVELDNGYSAPYTLNGAVSATGISSGSLTLSSSVNRSTSVDQYGFKITGGAETASLADAITAEHYIQFTLSAAEGYVFTVSSLELYGQSSATGADNAAILTSIDGFTSGSEIALANDIAGKTGGLDSASTGFGSITLAGAQYTNLSTITFRIYGWNTSGGSGVTYIRNRSGNDLVINGTTALAPVPEPSTYAAILGGVALIGVVVVRRRKRATIA